MTVLFVLHAETDSSSAELVDGGWCGPNACYYYYSDGTLEINGSGEMYDFNEVYAPWSEHRSDITKIVIGNGITYLGKLAFFECKNLKELTIPITVNSSSDYDNPFAICFNIEKINFTRGTDGYGFNYAEDRGSNAWFQNTPWYQSRDVMKEISFADGISHIGANAFRELNITSS